MIKLERIKGIKRKWCCRFGERIRRARAN